MLKSVNKQGEEMKKIRKTGWIVTGVLCVLMIGLLIAYIATDGTYGLEQPVSAYAHQAFDYVKNLKKM